jgi:two-component system, NtrC family, sensor histidine kinase KinB
MKRNNLLRHSIVAALALLTISILAVRLPTMATLGEYWGYGLLVLALTALTIVFSILMQRAEMSVAHSVGIAATLSVSQDAHALLLWAVFAGAAIGGATRVFRQQRPISASNNNRARWQSFIIIVSRVTVSFAIPSLVFAIGGGRHLPLNTLSGAVAPIMMVYITTYATLYLGMYLLDWLIEGRNPFQVLWESSLQILVVLVVPSAYAVVVTVIYTELPLPFFVLTIAGLILAIVTTFRYSRNQVVLREQVHEMRVLSELNHALQSCTSTEEVIAAVLRYVTQLAYISNLIVAVREPERGHVTYPLHLQQGTLGRAVAVDAVDIQLIGQLVHERTPLHIQTNVAAYLQQLGLPHHPYPVTWWSGSPLLARGDVVGVMVVYGMDGRKLSANDTESLRIFASALAAALDSAHLYRQQAERVMRLNTLNTISALLSSTLSQEDVLDTVTTSAGMLSEANAVAVYLAEDGKSSPKLQRTAGVDDEVLLTAQPALLTNPQSPKPDNAPKLKEFLPLIIRDVANDERAAGYSQVLLDANLRSIIELPLVGAEELIGVVALYFSTPQDPSQEFVEFLRTFASESVQAIKNAQLYTRIDEALEKRLIQLSILAAVGQQTSASINVQSIAAVVLNFATDYTQAARGVIVLQDENLNRLRVVAQRNYPDGLFEDVALFDTGILGSVRESGNYMQVDDISTDPNTVPLVPQARSQLIVPILREKGSMGLVVLESDETAAFTREDTNFIVQLFNQAAIAIDNRNLFHSVTRSRDRMEAILNAMTEAVVLMNTGGDIVMANPAVGLIGLQPDMLIEQNIHTLALNTALDLPSRMGFDGVEQMQRLLQQLGTGKRLASEPDLYSVQSAQGMVYIERDIISIRDEVGHVAGLLLVFYNQTQRIELDQTRDEFTRMIVHDLRSPLTAVTTSLNIIPRLVPEENPKRAQIVSVAKSSRQVIRKMIRRVDSLLDIAKMQSGEISLDSNSFALATPAANVLDELQPLAAERGITLTFNAPEGLVNIQADEDKVERVIQNLVDNALKYTADDTTITIYAAPLEDNPAYVRVDVVDRGPGIPPDYRERLFDRYVQVQGQRGTRRGVGLGLTFCRLVVEAHGGRIWVEENPGGGSVFSFTLPTAQAAEAAHG